MSKRWSYQGVEVKPTLLGGLKAEEVQAELNRQGANGWELVTVIVPAPVAGVELVFKREA